MKNKNGNVGLSRLGTKALLFIASLIVGCGEEQANRAPLAHDQTLNLQEDSSIEITLRGSDPDGDALTFRITSPPPHGGLSGTPPELVYTPMTGFFGDDQFSFIVSDTELDSAEATVRLTIEEVNKPPVAHGLNIVINQGEQVSLQLTGQDEQGGILSYQLISEPSQGTLEGTAPFLVYHAYPSFSGQDSFQFISQDHELDSEPATVTITVLPIDPRLQLQLNDTGITKNCNNDIDIISDCDVGRDITNNVTTDGDAGFSYIKLDSLGHSLATDASAWSCVQDQVTGLIWEIKTDDEGLQDRDWRYSWYNSSGQHDGGSTGVSLSSGCGNTLASGCDIEKYTAAINQIQLCGHSNWRVPSLIELKSIIHYGRSRPAIEQQYFPNTKNWAYWSASPNAGNEQLAWFVYFDHGYADYFNRSFSFHLRLVSDEISSTN